MLMSALECFHKSKRQAKIMCHKRSNFPTDLGKHISGLGLNFVLSSLDTFKKRRRCENKWSLGILSPPGHRTCSGAT